MGEARSAGYLTLLRRYPYNVMWGAQVISELGSSFTRVALFLVAAGVGLNGNESEGTGARVAAVMLAQAIPIVIGGPLTGVLADLFHRQRLMVLADIFRGLLVLAMIVSPSTLVLFALIVLHSLVGMIFGPARGSLIPRLVPKEELTTAAALSQLSSQGIGLLGPAIAGIAITAFGVRVAFLVDAASFFLSALVLWLLPLGEAGRPSPQGEIRGGRERLRDYWRRVGAGLGYARGSAVLRFYVGGLGASLLAAGLINVLQVRYALDTLALAPGPYGIVMSANGVGAIAAALLTGHFGARLRRSSLFAGSLLTLGLAFTAYAAHPGLLPLAVITACTNGAFVGAMVSVQSALYQDIAEEFRARTLALSSSVFNLAPLPGYLLAGTIARVVQPETGLAVSGLFIVVTAALAFAARPQASAEVKQAAAE